MTDYPYDNPDFAGLPDGAAAWWPAPGRPKKRPPCSCADPILSIRPGGTLRHHFCKRCHGKVAIEKIDAIHPRPSKRGGKP